MNAHTLRVSALLLTACSLFAAGAKKAFIEPAQPKWGEKIQFIYRSDLPDASLPASDHAIALVTIAFPGRNEQRRVPMALTEGRLRGEITVPESASYIS